MQAQKVSHQQVQSIGPIMRPQSFARYHRRARQLHRGVQHFCRHFRLENCANVDRKRGANEHSLQAKSDVPSQA